MEILVRIKALGKRRDILAPTAYTLPNGIASLRQLLHALVLLEVERYNRKETGAQLIPYLSPGALDAQAATGKVGFGRIYSDKKAEPKRMVDNALQCWKDGLVRVFMEEEELTELDAPLVIPHRAVFTFLRLTFLSGSMW